MKQLSLLFKKIFIVSIVFLNISLSGMGFNFDNLKKYVNSFFAVKQETIESLPVGTPEEKKFIWSLKTNWTDKPKLFEVNKRVMEQYLSVLDSPLTLKAFQLSLNSVEEYYVKAMDHGIADLVSISPDGEYAATAYSNRALMKIWDLSSIEPKELKIFNNGHDKISALKWLPADYLFLGCDNYFKILNMKDPKNPIEIFRYNIAQKVKEVSFNKQNHMALILYERFPNGIELWDFSDIKNPNLIKALDKIDVGSNTNISWVNNNSILVYDTIYDINNQSKKQTFQSLGYGTKIFASPNGKYIFMAAGEGGIKIFDVEKNGAIAKFSKIPESLKKYKGHSDNFSTTKNGIAWSPDSKFVLCMDSNMKAVLVWRVSDDKKILDNNPIAVLKTESDVETIDWNKETNIAIAGCYSGYIKVWNFAGVFDINKEFQKLTRTTNGMTAILLFEAILNNRKEQETLKTKNNFAFIISYPKLKTVFELLPKALQEGLIKEKYVEFKEIKK